MTKHTENLTELISVIQNKAKVQTSFDFRSKSGLQIIRIKKWPGLLRAIFIYLIITYVVFDDSLF